MLFVKQVSSQELQAEAYCMATISSGQKSDLDACVSKFLYELKNPPPSSASNLNNWPTDDLCMWIGHPTEGARVKAMLTQRKARCGELLFGVAEPNIISTKNSFNEAKSKCLSIGFKLNTEAYGRCVLELSK